ncbi:MAG: glycosyltransferase, partial [Pseudomonadota bacterium]
RLVISDDGSSDASLAVAETAAAADPRIEVVRNPNRLVFRNFGVSLRRATTPWFVWLAADDFWAPTFLEQAMARAAERPDAVSILPGWAFAGDAAGRPVPGTAPLDGQWAGRVRRYLAAPGGTRMYGLTRTDPLRAAFPDRNIVAWDWLMVLGLLRSGPMLRAPGPAVLFREETPLAAYVASVETWHTGSAIRWPARSMSLLALRGGLIPPGAIGALAALNLRKHEEYLAYRDPAAFAARLPLFRRLGLPIACKPGRAVEIAEYLLAEDPDRREGAGEMLSALAGSGDGAAARSLGRARASGRLPGAAAEAYAQAAALGDPDGRFWTAMNAGRPQGHGAWAAIIDIAAAGSADARAWLTAEAATGGVPDAVRPVLAHRLGIGLSEAAE